MTTFSKKVSDLSPKQRQLFELLMSKQGAGVSESLILPRPKDADLIPLSFAQQRLWFLHQLEPDSPAYNIPTALRLRGPLDIVALQAALTTLVERHESLRTTFEARDGKPFQRIAPATPVPLDIVDLTYLPETERGLATQQRVITESLRPFDLASGPLIRAALFRLAEAEQVLLITLHHIISDGWSMGILVRELTALYLASVSGMAASLPDLPIQYADYALWQQERLQGEAFDSHLAYWREQLQGSPTALSLPTDRPRPPMQTIRGAVEPFELSSALTEGLKSLSQRAGITLFVTLLAGFKILLARYTGEEDIVVGSPTSGRSRAEIEGLIGFFVNTLVLRTDLAGNPTFREALACVREVVRGAQAHQALPFERLVEALQPERDLSRQPLFQILFVFQNTPMGPLELPHLSIAPFDIEKGLSAFDVTLQLGEAGDKLVGYLEYSTDLFEAETIRRLLRHFRTLLEGIVANPDQRLMDLPLMEEAERRQCVEAWNATTAPYPDDQCVPQLFAAQAERSPDAIAVEWEDAHLTYDELNRRANQLAHYLQTLGVKPNTVVGLCVERSLEMLIGVLGILKAGGAYLPLDPNYPPERLAFMLEDSGAAALITQSHLLKTPKSQTPNPKASITICLDTDWETITNNQQSAISNQQSAIHPDNLAYLIYTSGSTGRPKGVAMPHRPLVNLIYWQLQNTALPAGARTLQFASLSFDVSFQEIFSTWCSGGALVLIPDEARRDPFETLRRLDTGAVERLFLPFIALQQIADVAEAQGLTPIHLREVITAGEQLRITPAIASLIGKLKNGVLHNQYGPSETHVVTAFSLDGSPSEWPALPPIGRPINNTQIYLLDSHLQPVPINVPGELYIGGANVARGYLGRPDLTAEKFIPNPFLQKDEGGRMKDEKGQRDSFILHPSSLILYKTGDLARYLPNGNIEFLGRIDHQVKVRGYRVELGEVEAALNEHPGVRETVVLARDDHAYGKRLVAYIVPVESQTTPGVDELRAFLKTRLPDYLLPSAFVFLDKLPLTPSGKVNRRALPAPDPAQRAVGEAFVSPRTPAEERLAEIWTQVLKLERVGVHDNFFELGGHSLLATQLISRVRTAFNVELPVRAIFETPTVAGLAERIRGRGDACVAPTCVAPTAPPIWRVSREVPLPLSFAQQRLWFIDQVEPGNPAYNLPFAVRLTGELDVTAFKRTLDEIVRRHEVLRTTFHLLDNEPRQIIAPSVGATDPLPLPVVRLQSTGDAQTAEIRQRAIEEAQRPFNLSQGPLIRAQLLRLDDHQHVLLLTLHHIIADGWSMEVILREVVMLYTAFAQAPTPTNSLPVRVRADGFNREDAVEGHLGQTPTLPALTIQYADFAVWQRAWLQGEVLEKQLAYWKHKLAGHLPVIELPTDRPRPPVQSFRGASQSFELSDDLSRALRDLGQREGCTLFMLLLAGFQVLLYRHSGQTDLLIGADVANRNRAETEALIGFFVNQLVLRTDLSSELRFRELLARVREVVVDAQAHQDLPFEKLVEVLRPQRSASHTPLFQVKITFQNLLPASAGLELPGLTLSPMAIDAGMTKYDLTLFLAETGPRILGSLEYSTDLFDAPTIARLVGHYETLLRSAVNQPEADLDELEMLTDAEKEHARREQQAREKAAIKQFRGIKPKAMSLPLGDEELKGN